MVSKFVSPFRSNFDSQLLIFDCGRIRLFQPWVAGSSIIDHEWLSGSTLQLCLLFISSGMLYALHQQTITLIHLSGYPGGGLLEV
jgi:hypothetical protein